jgi:glyoxylase I family protein
MQTQGLSHVSLTVRDMGSSAPWYEQLLGAQRLLEQDDGAGNRFTVLAAGPLLLGLRQWADTPGADRFDHRRVGLDHVGFSCGGADEVDQWRARLDELGIGHSGLETSPFGVHLNLRDPDGIALEFFAMAGDA